MGTITITSVNFSYERNCEENTIPPGSADIESQPVLSLILAWNFDFIYHVKLPGTKESFVVQSHTKTSITVSDAPFAELDLKDTIVVITSGSLEGRTFYIATYNENTIRSFGVDLTALEDRVDTFVIHVPSIMTEEDATPLSTADIEKQDILQNIQYWGENFRHLMPRGNNEWITADITTYLKENASSEYVFFLTIPTCRYEKEYFEINSVENESNPPCFNIIE